MNRTCRNVKILWNVDEIRLFFFQIHQYALYLVYEWVKFNCWKTLSCTEKYPPDLVLAISPLLKLPYRLEYINFLAFSLICNPIPRRLKLLQNIFKNSYFLMNVNDWNFVIIKEILISNQQKSCHQFDIKNRLT